MPTSNLDAQARAVRNSLERLRADLHGFLSSVGGALGSTIASRIAQPLDTVASHVEPLIALLAGSGTATRGAGRPPKGEGPAPKRRRRGGRGRKANLSADEIAVALKASRGNKSAAARALGVSQPTFYKYLRAGKAAALSTKQTGARPKSAAKVKK